MSEQAARITAKGIAVVMILNDPSLENIEAYEKIVSSKQDAELASRDKKITALLAALEGMLVYVEPMLTNVGAYRPPAVHAARAAIAEARGVKA